MTSCSIFSTVIQQLIIIILTGLWELHALTQAARSYALLTEYTLLLVFSIIYMYMYLFSLPFLLMFQSICPTRMRSPPECSRWLPLSPGRWPPSSQIGQRTQPCHVGPRRGPPAEERLTPLEWLPEHFHRLSGWMHQGWPRERHTWRGEWKKKCADDMNEYTNNQSFRGFSVGCCINEEKGNV